MVCQENMGDVSKKIKTQERVHCFYLTVPPKCLLKLRFFSSLINSLAMILLQNRNKKCLIVKKIHSLPKKIKYKYKVYTHRFQL